VNLENVRDVSAGGRHTFFVLDDQVMCCGDANHGQLGLDLEALRNFDRITSPTELVSMRGKNIQMVACGKYHTLFLIDGQVWATGHNKEGQIGINTVEN